MKGLHVIMLVLSTLVMALIPQGAAAGVTASINLPDDFEQTLLISDLNSPTKITFSPDGRVLVSEQAGRLLIFTAEGQLLDTFLDLRGSVMTSGSRGLFGVAFDPQFEANGYFFVYYTSMVSEYTRSAGSRSATLTPIWLTLTVN